MGGRSSGSGFKAGSAPAAAASAPAAAASTPAAAASTPAAATRMTNAQRALRSTTWREQATGGVLTVPGVGRAVAYDLYHPILGHRVEVNIYEPSGALVNSQYFSGRMMTHRARTWAWDQLDRRASRMP